MLLNEQKLYSIGAFSKLVGIPISSLRFYDEKGMLVPRERDAASNYRYYSESQLTDALTILQLKHLGMPLQDIKQFLACTDVENLKSLMQERLEDCRAEISRLETKYHATSQVFHQVGLGLALLKSRNGAVADPISQSFEIRYVPRMQIVSRSARTENFVNDRIMKSSMELFKICEDENLQIDGPLSIQFVNHAPSRFVTGKYELLLYYPIAPTKSEHRAIQLLGGCWMMSTLHRGSYDKITPLYEVLEEEIRQQNYKIIGDPFEEYLLNYMHINDQNCFITRLSYPIEYAAPSA